MLNLDKLVQTIDIFSGDDDELLTQLQKQLSSQHEVLARAPNLDTAVAMLDLRKHTLGALHLLHGLSIVKHDKQFFVKKAAALLTTGSPKQLAHDPKRFSLVCKRFLQDCQETGKPINAVLPLRTALEKLSPARHALLTPQHAQFALACILSKTYKTAIPILDRFDYKIDQQATGLKSEDVRLFFYYGAICYIAQKQYVKALQYLVNVISAPALMPSAVMVEAYKKYVLISLIEHGEVVGLPKYTNGSVTRICKQFCAPYDDLATSFSTRSVEDVGKVADTRAEIFMKDGNMGLVGHVMSALKRQNIQRLTKTYLTVSVDTVVEKFKFKDAAEVEFLLLNMIEAGSLSATFNQETRVIAFSDASEGYCSSSAVDYLAKQIHSAISLHHKVVNTDKDIELSDKFVQRLILNEKAPSAKHGGADEMQAMEMYMSSGFTG